MQCTKCDEPMSYIALNRHWWCNPCLSSQDGAAPSGQIQSAVYTEGKADVGWLAIDGLELLIAGALVAGGVALILTGWHKLGWTLIALGVAYFIFDNV